jgi:hypothetical protein
VTLVLLPGRLVEELSHLLGAWPWADSLALVVDPESGDATVHADMGDAPRHGLLVAAFAPVGVGVAAFLALAWVVVVWGVWPSAAREWVVVGIGSIWWGRLMLPSGSDREVLQR